MNTPWIAMNMCLSLLVKERPGRALAMDILIARVAGGVGSYQLGDGEHSRRQDWLMASLSFVSSGCGSFTKDMTQTSIETYL